MSIERLHIVQQRIARACERAGRDPREVCLVAVSKTWPVEALRALYDAGVRDFGESYVQEWRPKAEQMPDDVRWHIIGHLQSNKVKYLRGRAHLVHSVDRASLLDALAKHASDDAPASVLLQLNLASEATKRGIDEDALDALLSHATASPSLCVRGLMTIPPPADADEHNRPYFSQLARLRIHAQRWLDARGLLDAHPCDLLSMGMSDDFEIAVEQGATHVRVGSALFGARG